MKLLLYSKSSKMTYATDDFNLKIAKTFYFML
jgi:hypothetical protein